MDESNSKDITRNRQHERDDQKDTRVPRYTPIRRHPWPFKSQESIYVRVPRYGPEW